MRLIPGQPAPDFDVEAFDGRRIRPGDFSGRRWLLSFHRFAACPFCNLRVHRLREAYADLDAAGLSIVAFFQSANDVIARGVGRQDAPFPIVGDPDMAVYARYGVERSGGAVLKGAIRRMPAAFASMARGYVPRTMDGHASLVPASFLIGPDGAIATAYYGRDIGDHLPLDTVRAFASSAAAPGNPIAAVARP